jgi:chemotaxis protein methyltransferase CheR
MKASAVLSDPDYLQLKEWVIGHTGLAYYSDKDADFAERIQRRLAALRVRDCSSYLRILGGRPMGEQEIDSLVAELTIGETYFFRQREHFDELRVRILPDLIERNRASRRLRIWSAGCATGAEPYSVALLLRLELADELIGWDVGILGTDINREFLARARAAKFDDWAFRESPDDLKTRCFERDGRRWALRREFKGLVSFQFHNLMSGSCPVTSCGAPVFDLILCRNVMIYFGAENVRATVELLHNCLAAGGWLLVGHAEPNS